jgi:hypothetical protein
MSPQFCHTEEHDCLFMEWGETKSIWYGGLYLAPDDGWWWVWSNRWNDWKEKPKYSEKTCPSITLPTIYHISWPGLEPWSVAVGIQRLTAWAMARLSREVGILSVYCQPELSVSGDVSASGVVVLDHSGLTVSGTCLCCVFKRLPRLIVPSLFLSAFSTVTWLLPLPGTKI